MREAERTADELGSRLAAYEPPESEATDDEGEGEPAEAPPVRSLRSRLTDAAAKKKGDRGAGYGT
jgi:hypothetical protein